MHSINLLPADRRAVLQRQNILSIITRLVLVTLFGFVLLSLAASSLAITNWYQAAQQEKKNKAALDAQVNNYTTIRATVIQQNQLLAKVDQLGQEKNTWSQKIAELLSVVPLGVHIHSMNGAITSTDTLLTISGQADTRQALALLEDNLRSLPWVETIDAPRSNLLDRFNPAYTFTLHLK